MVRFNASREERSPGREGVDRDPFMCSLVSTLYLPALVRASFRDTELPPIGHVLEMPYAGLAISADAEHLEVNVLRRQRAHYFLKRSKQVVNPGENFNLFDPPDVLCGDDVSPAGAIFPLPIQPRACPAR